MDSYAGIATHYVPSEHLAALEARLSDLDTDNHDVINMAIEAFVSKPLHDLKYTLSEHRNAIDRCFRFNTVEEIISELEKENTLFAEKTLKALRIMSPTSLKVALQQLREGARLGIADCFRMEYQLASQIVPGHDFLEGIKALLIEKTLRPKWEHATIDDVDHEKMLEHYFRSQTPNTLSLSNGSSWMEYPYSRYGLPSEDEIMVIAGDIQVGGSLQLKAEEVAEMCMKKSNGKIGVREKVMEFLSRKAMKGPEGKCHRRRSRVITSHL